MLYFKHLVNVRTRLIIQAHLVYIYTPLMNVIFICLSIQDARRITLQMAKDYEDALCNRLEILAKELPNETKVNCQ
jgi:hypothetical protein